MIFFTVKSWKLKAYGATIASFGPFSALNFMFYENFKCNVIHNLNPKSLLFLVFVCKDPKLPGLLESLILSTLSSSLATFITSPLDMAKLRMQIQRGERALKGTPSASLSEGRFGYKNMFHGIYLILKNEGFFALYKGNKIFYFSLKLIVQSGVTPKILQGSFNVMLSFTLLEWLRKKILLKYYDYQQ